MTMRFLWLPAVALLVVAGCGGGSSTQPSQRSGPVVLDSAMAEGLLDKADSVLAEAIDSGQPPLQSLAFETFLATGQAPPQYDFRALNDPRVRVVALVVAVKQNSPAARDMAVASLRDGDPSLRLAGAWGLLVAANDASQAPVLTDGLASRDVAVRRNAAWLFGLMDNRSAVDMLRARLDDPDAVVVLRTAEALGRLGSSDGLAAVRSLTEYEQHAVRCWATRLLGRIGAKADIPRLERLADSRFLDVKFAAIGSLARLGNFTRIESLVEMLGANARTLRLQAAKDPQLADVIASMKDAELEAFATDLRRLAARELGETGYAPALLPLGHSMESRDLLERTVAASSASKILWESQPWVKRAMSDQAPAQPPRKPGQVERLLGQPRR
jgi:HEAT repeat protein